MKKKNERERLAEAIQLLEIIRAQELILLKEQFHVVHESLKPINLIKNTLHEITSSPDIKNNLLENVMGLATGYLSKKVLVGSSHNPVKKILGTLLQFAIANIVSKNADAIKSTGENIFKRFMKYRREADLKFQNDENKTGKQNHS